MATILITGGTGLIGKVLQQELIKQGHKLNILSRKKSSLANYYYWDINNNEIDKKAFEGVEHIVHLAGDNIADKRWTEKRKKEIIDSRVLSMKLISDSLFKNNIKLKSFVGASAIGIYGMSNSDKLFTETDSGSVDFLSDCCKEWENSYKNLGNNTEQKTILRLGVVISKNGGALKQLLPLFKLGLGSSIGSGKQYMPWIDIDDIVNLIIESLFNKNYNGVYNAVSTEIITNDQFSLQVANALQKPFFMPRVPAFIIKLIFGEKANIILQGVKVSNQKLVDNGFKFKYESLKSSLQKELN